MCHVTFTRGSSSSASSIWLSMAVAGARCQWLKLAQTREISGLDNPSGYGAAAWAHPRVKACERALERGCEGGSGPGSDWFLPGFGKIHPLPPGLSYLWEEI